MDTSTTRGTPSLTHCCGGFYSSYVAARRSELEQETGANFDPLLKNLCCFTMEERRSGLSPTPVPELWAKIAAVYANILQRSVPTWPSLLVERALLKLVNARVGKKQDGSIALDTSEATTIGARLLARAHFIIDPRVALPSDNVGEK